MLDIRFIRENADAVQENARKKGYEVSVAQLLERDESRRQLTQVVDELRERRNANAAHLKDGRPEQSVIDEGRRIKLELAERELQLNALDAECLALQKAIPNMASDDVPVGASEDENVIQRTVGTPRVLWFCAAQSC